MSLNIDLWLFRSCYVLLATTSVARYTMRSWIPGQQHADRVARLASISDAIHLENVNFRTACIAESWNGKVQGWTLELTRAEIRDKTCEPGVSLISGR